MSFLLRWLSKLAAGERFERPYPDSKSRVLPLDDPASHGQRDCIPKSESPRFVSEAQKNHALLMCPRYMNVPSPAPCHVAVAGVRKQPVWGLNVIARTQFLL